MFRDAYRRDNKKIRPDEALLCQLEWKMQQAQQEKPAETARGGRRRRWVRPTIAAAACLAVLVSAGALYAGLRPGPQVAGTGKVINGADYGQAYQAVKAMEPRFDLGDWFRGLFGFLGKGVQNEADGSSGSASAEAGGVQNYSDTNTQVDGVDEADVTKTDGAYIYTLSGGRLHIVRADGAALETAAELDYSQGNAMPRALEFYIKGDRLVLLCRTYGGMTEGQESSWDGTVTWAAVYDIADRTSPTLLGVQGQAGDYLSSRLVGNTLYLATSQSLPEKAEKGDKATYVPTLYTQDGAAAMAEEDLCIPPIPAGRQYTVLTAVDLLSPQGHTSAKAVLGGGDNLYANTQNLFLAVPRTVREEGGQVYTATDLLRFSLDGGEIQLQASGTVPGTLINQFAMDEYEGIFRVVTTQSGGTETVSGGIASYVVGDTVNNLYTLNQSLQIVGKLEGLAKGERVYSVRFNGEVGYFVTFRQVDPLFTVDLEDPANPQVLSALKIPGFSDYLHPYAPGLLLGFGQQADPYTGATQGLKLAMFDVSDPADVTERHSLPLKEDWSEASQNHKAILVDAERSLIGFPAGNAYYLYGYSEQDGFFLRAQLPLSDGTSARGLYIGDTFYTVEEGRIAAYALSDFQPLASLVL
ncbi:MAG TPA: beta-propeller domain-containing protein [Firmicutes bacterium]|nr:beta-propeller domain-containing protein [Bacillota bacterium]